MSPGAETSPLRLAGRLRVDLTAVSYHVRMLAECGAIELVRVARGEAGSDRHLYVRTIEDEWALSALQAEDCR